MPRRAPLILSILLALVALLLWLIMERGSCLSTPTRSSPSTDNPRAVAAHSNSPELDASQQAKSELLRVDAVSAQAVPKPAADLLTVRVLANATETPAPNAEVLLFTGMNEESISVGERSDFLAASLDERIEHWGSLFRCNADGVVQIPLPSESEFSLAARSEGRWDRKDLRRVNVKREPEVVLELRRPLHLRVIVMNAADHPMPGMTVAYCALEGSQGHNLRLATTGEDGIAEFRHLREAVEQVGWQVTEHVVGLCLASDPLVRAAFDPLAPPDEPILLRMPSTGSVEIKVLDFAGAPILDGLEVVLQRVSTSQRPADRPPELSMWPDGGRGMHRIPVQQGIARFEHVGLGLRLEYGADFSGTGLVEHNEAAGPLDPGQTVHFTLRQAVAYPELTGRLVGASGAPLPLTEFEAEIYPENYPLRMLKRNLRTDEQGHFRTAFPPQRERPGRTILLGHQERNGRISLALAEFILPLDPGETDLGDVMLGGALLVSGIALDPFEQPLQGAHGRIEAVSFDSEAAAGLKGPFRVLDWNSGEDGRFEVKGAAPAGRYKLRYSRVDGERTWYSKDQVFAAGDKDLSLRFGPPGNLHGRVLVDDGVPLKDLRIKLVQEGLEIVAGDLWQDGFFSLRPTRSGLATLQVQMLEHGWLVWSQPEVPVNPAQATDFGLIDLRGLLTVTPIELHAPDGRSVQQARCWIESDDGTWTHMEAAFPRRMIAPGRDRSCLIAAGGFAEVEVHLDGTQQVVPLSEPFRAEISLSGLPSLSASARWSLTLKPALAEGHAPPQSYVGDWLPVDASSLELKFPSVGEYLPELYWRADRTSAPVLVPMAFGNLAPSLRIIVSSAPQFFALSLDVEALGQFMKSH